MTKKRVASWIVTGVLVAGAGAALAEENDPVVTDETVPTTVVEATTTVETLDDVTPTTVAGTTDAEVDVDVEVVGTGGGNADAAHNHECDEAWGNHGAWAAANAHAMKTGDDVSCDGPTPVAADAEVTDAHGKGRGRGAGK